MRDVLAGVAAIVLLLAAASLATTLQTFRRRRLRARAAEQDQGRAVIAEIPGDEDLVLFTADATHFHFRDHAIDKTAIVAVRLLINGAQIAEGRRRAAERGEGVPAERDRGAGAPGVIDDRPEGIARDRWDVAIETATGTMLVECGAIRERVSQELARTVFDAVKHDMERRDDDV
ncbi:MAG: hypothetical protein HY048_09585 [Acidobacteria bacterium]|nr:hypothetical protein [Acidobacteriota bacterium]